MMFFLGPMFSKAEEYVVETKNIEILKEKYHLKVLDQIPNTHMYRIHLEHGIEQLKDDPIVESIDENMLVYLQTEHMFNSGNFMWGEESMHFPKSIVAGYPVKVAVLDTGVDTTHPSLQGYIIDGYNAFNVGEEAIDDNGHGTNVIGTIALHSPQSIKIVPVKVLDSNGQGSLYSVLKGLYYAIHENVDIINMSLGLPVDVPALREGITEAIKKGIIVVASTGNQGYPFLMYPAMYEPVIAVGSYNMQERRSVFSQYGEMIDFVAPGESIYTTGLNHSFVFVNGTSISAAWMTKAISWLYTQSLNRDIERTQYLLQRAAMDFGGDGFDIETGFGKVNVSRLLLWNDIETESLWRYMEGESIVPKSKIWNISFNIPINEKQDFDSLIIVLNEKNEQVQEVTIELSDDRKQIIIYPPKNGYEEGAYTLCIHKGICSEKKSCLKQSVRKRFFVSMKSFLYKK